jgi:deoxyhypusine synthase
MNQQKHSKDQRNNAKKIFNAAHEDIFKKTVSHFNVNHKSNVFDIIKSFDGTAFQSRNLAKCLNVMLDMLQDPERPTIFLALAGAMIPGGLRKILRDMLDLRMIDVLVSTGANLYHDVFEALGFHHYLAQKKVSDLELRKHQVNRMYDVYASDEEFNKTDIFIKNFADSLQPNIYSTRDFLNRLGNNLQDKNSILSTAAKKNIPVFCPAIADSGIGLSLAWNTQKRKEANRQPLLIDTIQDNLEILKIKIEATKTGAIHIGGGVPKNYIQQIAPMGEILNLKMPSHSYGIQITTDDPKWGGLSGCTFSESQSWGKYTDNARFATVYLDATIGLPLLFTACLEMKKTWYPRKALQIDFSK